MKLHMSQNEYLIPDTYKMYSRQLLNLDAQMWSAMVLSHEIIIFVYQIRKIVRKI